MESPTEIEIAPWQRVDVKSAIDQFKYQIFLLMTDQNLREDFTLFIAAVSKLRSDQIKQLKKEGVSGYERSRVNNFLDEHIPNYRQFLYLKDPSCQLCGVRFTSIKEATIDHIIPISIGGAKGICNQQLAHGPCNVLKSNRNIQSFKELEPCELKNICISF